MNEYEVRYKTATGQKYVGSTIGHDEQEAIMNFQAKMDLYAYGQDYEVTGILFYKKLRMCCK